MRELLTVMDTKYKRLEYLESTGTQWIDTGLRANQDTTVRVKASTTKSGTQVYAGCTTSGNIWVVGQQSTNNYLFGQYYTTYSNDRIVSNISGNDGVIRILELRKNEFYINGNYIGNNTPKTFTTNTIKLFAHNPSSSIASIKMYNAQVLDGNMNFLRNMIPVMRKSDNEIGMLDLVEGKFYTNAGTGKFTANLDTMYAIIQDSPTQSPYGVFSGFSSSNYLALQQQLDTTKPFELVAKINVNSIGSAQTVIGTSASTYIQLGVRGTGVVMMLLGTGGASFNIGTLYSSTVLSTDTDYWIKGKFTGTKYELYLSTDGTNWNLENSIESSTLISNTPITLQMGNGHTSNWYFRGSIDLNRSYIKIDDTKYKLQAVVGYTIVGSPTIVDGVVSGFSDSNYLTLPNYSGNITSLERVFRVNANGVSKNQNIILRQLLSNPPSLIRLSNTTAYLTFRYVENGVTASTYIQTPENSIDLNNYVYIKTIIRNGFQGIYLSGNGVNYQLSVSSNFAEINFANYLRSLRIGNRGDNTNNFSGSIDIANSYIKINNKLWFNGLEA